MTGETDVAPPAVEDPTVQNVDMPVAEPEQEEDGVPQDTEKLPDAYEGLGPEEALTKAKEINDHLRSLLSDHEENPRHGHIIKKRTFTSPPQVHRARPVPRGDYSHAPSRIREILHENEVLVEKLSRISAAPLQTVPKGYLPPELRVAQTAPATINRRKMESRIAAENMALYRRLQAIKPTPAFSRKTLESHHVAHQKYLQTRRNFRPSPASFQPSWS